MGVHVATFKAPTDEELAHDFLWRVHPTRPPGAHLHLRPQPLRGRADRAGPRAGAGGPLAGPLRRHPRLRADAGGRGHGRAQVLHISATSRPSGGPGRRTPPSAGSSASATWPARALGRLPGRLRGGHPAPATPDTPWIVVPADKKWHRDLVICRTIVATLESLDLRYPEPEEDLSGVVVVARPVGWPALSRPCRAGRGQQAPAPGLLHPALGGGDGHAVGSGQLGQGGPRWRPAGGRRRRRRRRRRRGSPAPRCAAGPPGSSPGGRRNHRSGAGVELGVGGRLDAPTGMDRRTPADTGPPRGARPGARGRHRPRPGGPARSRRRRHRARDRATRATRHRRQPGGGPRTAAAEGEAAYVRLTGQAEAD